MYDCTSCYMIVFVVDYLCVLSDCMSVWLFACMLVYVVWTHTFVPFVCLFVCLYVCMHVYVCMCVYMHECVGKNMTCFWGECIQT